MSMFDALAKILLYANFLWQQGAIILFTWGKYTTKVL